jgi:hypothetical protein
MTSNLGNLHITRVESGVLTLGWNFRLRVAGRIESKFFSDRSYGGKANALIVARMYRNARLEQLGTKGLMRRIGRKDSRNISGIVGVRRTRIMANGKEYICWSAQWPLSRGRHFIRRFSILKFGEAKAKQLAIQARREGLKALKEQRSR